MDIILFIIFSLVCLYLFLNFLHNNTIDRNFGKQSVYFSIKELKQYRTDAIRLGLATVEFDYVWGIKVTPFSFWYLLYICFSNNKSVRKTPWNNYL